MIRLALVGCRRGGEPYAEAAGRLRGAGARRFSDAKERSSQYREEMESQGVIHVSAPAFRAL